MGAGTSNGSGGTSRTVTCGSCVVIQRADYQIAHESEPRVRVGHLRVVSADEAWAAASVDAVEDVLELVAYR